MNARSLFSVTSSLLLCKNPKFCHQNSVSLFVRTQEYPWAPMRLIYQGALPTLKPIEQRNYNRNWNRWSNFHHRHISSAAPIPKRWSAKMWLLGAALAPASMLFWLIHDSEPDAFAQMAALQVDEQDELNFDDHEQIYKTKTTSELLFNLAILKLCSYNVITEQSPKLLAFFDRIHCSAPIYWVVKKTFFKQFCAGETHDEAVAVADLLYKSGLKSILDYSVESGSSAQIFDEHAAAVIRTIEASANDTDKIAFSCLKMSGLTSQHLLRRLSELTQYHNSPKGPPPPSLNREEQLEYLQMYERLANICKSASQNQVKLLIDAEETYFQPAIDDIAMRLCQIYNTDQPLIHNTYQMYLKDGLQRLQRDLDASKKDRYKLGVKLVRGAYMHTENRVAQENNRSSPVHNSIEDTHDSYNKAITVLLNNIKTNNVSVMVATHNEQSVKYAYKEMRRLGISPDNQSICFAQLYGMCDHISLTLAQKNISVCKYVPFGPVREVIPYLTRRMQENKGFVARTLKERSLLRKEIKRRLLPR